MRTVAKRATTGKSANLMVRLDAASKRLVQRVASLRGVSASDYVRSVLIADAQRELAEVENRVISLNRMEQLAFWQALQSPVELTAAQRRLGRIMRGEL